MELNVSDNSFPLFDDLNIFFASYLIFCRKDNENRNQFDSQLSTVNKILMSTNWMVHREGDVREQTRSLPGHRNMYDHLKRRPFAQTRDVPGKHEPGGGSFHPGSSHVRSVPGCIKSPGK